MMLTSPAVSITARLRTQPRCTETLIEQDSHVVTRDTRLGPSYVVDSGGQDLQFVDVRRVWLRWWPDASERVDPRGAESPRRELPTVCAVGGIHYRTTMGQIR